MCWRWIAASHRCSPNWTENFEISQRYASQNGTPLRQGVWMPQQILARKASNISWAMRTFPSSRRSIMELMLVKWFWCGCRNSCSVTFFPHQIVRDEPWSMVLCCIWPTAWQAHTLWNGQYWREHRNQKNKRHEFSCSALNGTNEAQSSAFGRSEEIFLLWELWIYSGGYRNARINKERKSK